MAPGSSSFVSNDYTVIANHIESITANGGTGDNVVNIEDTSANDVLTIQPGLAELIGGGSTFRAENCSTIVATSTSGMDTVKIYDTTGDDSFTASPTEASMIGDGYDVATQGFRYVMGYSTAGTDTANLYDSRRRRHAHHTYRVRETGRKRLLLDRHRLPLHQCLCLRRR